MLDALSGLPGTRGIQPPSLTAAFKARHYRQRPALPSEGNGSRAFRCFLWSRGRGPRPRHWRDIHNQRRELVGSRRRLRPLASALIGLVRVVGGNRPASVRPLSSHAARLRRPSGTRAPPALATCRGRGSSSGNGRRGDRRGERRGCRGRGLNWSCRPYGMELVRFQAAPGLAEAAGRFKPAHRGPFPSPRCPAAGRPHASAPLDGAGGQPGDDLALGEDRQQQHREASRSAPPRRADPSSAGRRRACCRPRPAACGSRGRRARSPKTKLFHEKITARMKATAMPGPRDRQRDVAEHLPARCAVDRAPPPRAPSASSRNSRS